MQILIVIEPRISGERATKVIKKTAFPNSHRVEAVRFSGGIWLLWDDSKVTIEAVRHHQQYLHLKMTKDLHWWYLTAIYVSPIELKRKALWEEVHSIAGLINSPWLLAGDFNTLSSPTEKEGGNPASIRKCAIFSNWIENSGLIDLGSTGPQFTWKRDNVQERLDRALGNLPWQEKFSTNLIHLPRIGSDHRPILIKVSTEDARSKQDRPFRFQAACLLHAEFDDFLKRNWRQSGDIATSIERLTKQMQDWNVNTFGKIFLWRRFRGKGCLPG